MLKFSQLNASGLALLRTNISDKMQAVQKCLHKDSNGLREAITLKLFSRDFSYTENDIPSQI